MVQQQIFNEILVSWLRIPIVYQSKIYWQKVPYWIAWPLLSILFILFVNFLKVILMGTEILAIAPTIAFTLLLIDGGVAPIFVHNRFQQVILHISNIAILSPTDRKEYIDKNQNELNKIFSWNIHKWSSMFQMGLFITLIGIPPLLIAEIHRFNVAKIMFLDYFLLIVTAIFVGSATSRIPILIHFLYNLFRIKLRPTFLQYPPSYLRSVSNYLFQSAMTVSLAFGFIGFMIVTFPQGPITDTTIFIYMAIAMFVVLISYLWPQWIIHNSLKQYKQNIIDKFSDIVENYLPYVFKEDTPQNMQLIKQVRDAEITLHGMKEWPFDIEVIPKLLSLISPTILSGLLKLFIH